MQHASLRIHVEAVREITDAIAWYSERSANAADDFISAVSDAIQEALASPERFPAYLHGTRRVRLKNHFRYVVVFRVIDSVLYIFAVAHTSRRPGYWKNRTF
jgi:toxin ParE1/3/4